MIDEPAACDAETVKGKMSIDVFVTAFELWKSDLSCDEVCQVSVTLRSRGHDQEDYPIQRVAEPGAAEIVTNTVDTLTCQNS